MFCTDFNIYMQEQEDFENAFGVFYGSFGSPVKERRNKPEKQQDKYSDKPKQDFSKQREQKRKYEV